MTPQPDSVEQKALGNDMTTSRRKRTSRPKRGFIAQARWEQISNNVSEEYIDHGDTSFATKAELCETIIAVQKHWWEWLHRKDAALTDIAITALKAGLYKTPEPSEQKAAEKLSAS